MPRFPTFDDASDRILAFVRDHARSCSAVRWVFREDFYHLDQHRVVARASVATGDDSLARQVYAKGVASGFGCRVIAGFTAGEFVYCWIETCNDPVDAESKWMPMESGLSVSIRKPLPEATLVGLPSWLWRQWFSFRLRRQMSFDTGVPFRGTLVA